MIVLSGMGGIAPKVTPELLPNSMAQSALNAILNKRGSGDSSAIVITAFF